MAQASSLIAPHGGALVNRGVPAEQVAAFSAQVASLPKLPVSAADLSTVYRIADGTLSPLTGPMNQDVYNRVLDEKAIVHHGKKLAWTIPLSLPVTAELAAQLKPGQRVALTSNGNVVGDLTIGSVFAWDKSRYLTAVYGTERTDHPGADMVLKGEADKTHMVGGELRALPQNKPASFGKYILSPCEVRALLATKNWDAVVAFQTRNPLHRAHEYALVYGLETLLREGKNAGAVLNPLVGETKGDDVSAEIRMRTYERLIQSRELGEGDSDKALWSKVGGSVADRVLLMGLDIKMFYGGPSEAIMHAIYRQNLGFTHIVIGRKHADAPYHDGKPIWGDFDAQQIFDRQNQNGASGGGGASGGASGGELLIKPVKVGFAAYYESIGRVDLMERHDGEKPLFISGKEVRATLLKGEMVDPRVMRPSTSQILAAAMKQA